MTVAGCPFNYQFEFQELRVRVQLGEQPGVGPGGDGPLYRLLGAPVRLGAPEGAAEQLEHPGIGPQHPDRQFLGIALDVHDDPEVGGRDQRVQDAFQLGPVRAVR